LCKKIDVKLLSVCEKMSENRRPQGGGIFDSHYIASRPHRWPSWTDLVRWTYKLA